MKASAVKGGPVWTFFRTKGGLQKRTSALFGAKTSDFSKFMMCPHGQGGEGFEPMRTFFGEGGGSIFRDFVRTSFMDSP